MGPRPPPAAACAPQPGLGLALPAPASPSRNGPAKTSALPGAPFNFRLSQDQECICLGQDTHPSPHSGHPCSRSARVPAATPLMGKAIPDVPRGLTPAAPGSCRKWFLERRGQSQSHLLALT